MPIPGLQYFFGFGTDAKTAQPPWLQSEGQLKAFLEEQQIKTELWGTGTYKSIGDLLSELRDRASTLQFETPKASVYNATAPPAPVLRRVVEPVFIRLRWRTKVLVQEAQRFPDGRFRLRKMLLAEKKEPRDAGGLFSTVLRCLNEELGIDCEQLEEDGVLDFRADKYHFEIEQLESPSYPGLQSAYHSHHVEVEILDKGLEVFRGCGLPECSDFTSQEISDLGATTHFWRWCEFASAVQEGVVRFPPQALVHTASDGATLAQNSQDSEELPQGTRVLTKQDVPDEAALTVYLQKAGIDPKRFGVDKAKTVGHLLKECHKGESALEWNAETKTLRRVVEPVFIQFRHGNFVLVEKEQVLEDGRVRARNMLMAEKKAPEDLSIADTAYRGLQEELNLPADFPEMPTVVRFLTEAYCCVAERSESASFPGLSCVYVTHYCALQLLPEGVEAFDRLGQLQENFETQEGKKINRWYWMDANKAKLTKVKGFPDLQDSSGSDGHAPPDWEDFDNVPTDTGGLRAALEAGGVNVSMWGDYANSVLLALARELKTGQSHLERDRNSGKVRRVVKSKLLQVKVSEEQEEVRPRFRGSLRSMSSMESESVEEDKSRLEGAKNLVNYRSDLACFEVEQEDMSSYPGLPCVHQTRVVQFAKVDTPDANAKAPSTPETGLGRQSRTSKRKNTLLGLTDDPNTVARVTGRYDQGVFPVLLPGGRASEHKYESGSNGSKKSGGGWLAKLLCCQAKARNSSRERV